MTDNTTCSQPAKIKTPTFYFSVRDLGGGKGARWESILIQNGCTCKDEMTWTWRFCSFTAVF